MMPPAWLNELEVKGSDPRTSLLISIYKASSRRKNSRLDIPGRAPVETIYSSELVIFNPSD